MRFMKRAFLVLALVFFAVTVKFVHSRMYVDQEFGPSSMLAAALLSVATLVLVMSYLLIDSKLRDKVVGFWMISISSAVTYLVADLLAGYFLITPLSPELIPDPIRHHKLVPGAHAKFDQKDFSYIQRNNELGLRGAEISREKPPATYRIITLGDSFTMGKGVEDTETFTYRLQELLANRLGQCDSAFERIEVLNGGVDSYAPILAHLYLSGELASLDPDLVIFSLDNSDLIQEAAYRSVAVRDESGAIIAVPGKQAKESMSMRFRHWVENNLYITRLVLFYTNKWMGHKDLSVGGVVSRANAEIVAHTLAGDQLDRSQQWSDIFDSIARMDQFASAQSFDFVLAVYPWPHQVSDDLWNPGRKTFLDEDDVAREAYDEMLLAMASEAGITAMSAYDAFERYSGPEKLYFDNDMHFTVHGHELMSSELARWLDENGYVEHWCAD